jgi:PAS domain S-box-containing protein
MTDQKKTKAELISELVNLRETVAELKESETQLKQAEKELRESEAKYRNLLDNLPAITYIGALDSNSTTLYISPQIKNILGISASDFEADPDSWTKMIHPEDRERVIAEGSHYHSKIGLHALEYRMITKDGDEIYVYDKGWVVEDDNGKPLYRQSVIYDITNRKQAEKELRESEAKYRALVDNLPAITYIAALDSNSTTLYISPQIENILGVSTSDFKADPDLWRKMLHPEDRERVMAEVSHYHSKREPFTVEYRMITTGGDERYIYDDAWIIEDDNGKPLYSQGVMHDITNRKQAEKAQRESEQKYRLLFETAKDAIFISDEKGKFIDVNQAACELLGYSKEEFMELTIKDVDPEGYERLIKARDRHVKDSMFEVNLRRKDGTVFPAEVNGTVFVSGSQTMSLAIARDISERKQAEKAQRESEQKYRLLFETAKDAIFISDEKGKFIDVNQAACESLGYSKEEFMELSIKEIDTDPEGYEQFAKLRNGRAKSTTFEVNQRRKDGTILPVEISGAFFVSHGQRMSLAIARDISERKQAEASISHERDKLTAILDSMADGVYIVNQKYDIEYINPTIRKEFGPIDGRKCYEYLRNLKAVCPWCKIKDVFAGKIVRWEWYCSRNNKTYDLLDTRLTNIDGSMSKLEIFRDITERKQTEESLRESETRFRELFNNMPIGVAVYKAVDEGADFVFKDYNPAGTKMDHIKREAVIGRRITEVFPGIVEFGLLDVFRRVWKTGEQEHHPVSIYKDDKLERWRENKVYKLPSGDIVAVYTDETERVKTAEALKESEAHKQALLDGSPDMIIQVDTNMKIQWANKAALIMNPNAIGQTCHKAFPGRDESCEGCPCRKAISTGKIEMGIQHQPALESVRGESYWENIGVPVMNSEGKVVGVIEISRNITKRKQVEEQIKAYQEQLQSLASEMSSAEERQRRQFATDLHDNIGQLLAVTNIKLGSARKMAPPGEMAELLDVINGLIVKAFHCTQSLTHDLYPPILYKLGLEPAVEGLLENLEKEHGIAYRIETKGKDKPLDNDISSLLFRAVRELLINITKHAKADEVRVSIQKWGDQIKISVEDNGVGFDTSQIKPVSKQAKGFGLFSISERLGYQGGKLNIKSVIGRGTCITITAPLTTTH